MNFGCDYYPEHWPEARWRMDAQLMKQAGMNVVRLAEFSWSRLEPCDGQFDFSWLDRAIEVLVSEGISIVLGTPSATPPAWLIEKHPEILPVSADGTIMGFGGRLHTCHSQPVYRNYTREIVMAMAQHYALHPQVIGWQTDNELGTTLGDLCYCTSCREKFHLWLKHKYGSIHALNQEWGTIFWSQTYDKWEQVPIPTPVPAIHNPSLLLDWKRFQSDLEVEFQQLQIDILRLFAPNQWITHNMMGLHAKLNYFDLGRNLDFVSWDNYPMGFWLNQGADPYNVAMAHDLMRGIKNKPFWVMEQQAGPAGWETLGNTPRPGQLRLWTYQAAAHGADAIVYFRWRSCRFGAEQYWHGILPHSGNPGRRYEEIRTTGEELQGVMHLLEGSMPNAEVGIVYSYDQLWAFQIQPHHPDLTYQGQLAIYYKAMYDMNIPVDMLELNGDREWFAYKIIVAPLLFLMTEGVADKIKSYVQSGGTALITMRSGVKNWNNIVSDLEPPGCLAELLGIKILDYDCLLGNTQGIQWVVPNHGEKQNYEVKKWCDVITAITAKTEAVYTKDYYAGKPAVTVNQYGRGKAWYVATEPEQDFIRVMMQIIVLQSKILPIVTTPEGVESARRVTQEGKIYIFLMNHTKEQKQLVIPKEWKPIVGERPQDDRLTLPGFGVSIMAVLTKN
ncbi:MAG TPA: beta-galactosidase [Bacilli bacterium]